MKIVLFDYEYPKVLEDSGSQDTWGYIQILVSLGHEMSFISLTKSEPSDDLLSKFQELGVKHFSMADMDNKHMVLLETSIREASLAWIQRIHVFTNVVGWVQHFNPMLPTIFGTVDLHFLREFRSSLRPFRVTKMINSGRILLQELNAIKDATCTVVVSSYERRLLGILKPTKTVRQIDLPRNLRVGDTAFEHRNGVAFIGGFNHRPNVDAVEYFLSKIWPLAIKIDPNLRLKIAGSNMPKSLSEKIRLAPNTEVVGFVESTFDFFDSVRVSIAPLRFGAGVKGKIVTSLLHGVPVVASQLAVEGMSLKPGIDLLASQSRIGFAQAMISLHNDKTAWEAMRSRGLQTATTIYSFSAVSSQIEEMLKELGISNKDNE